MEPKSQFFLDRSSQALNNRELQDTFRKVGGGFAKKRGEARAALPEFDQLRDEARDIKDHVLENLDLYLEEFEKNVLNSGGHVHWAKTDQDACAIIAELCEKVDARTITKGKSMITEEIGLNDYLENAGFEVVETDLGDYLIQIRGEGPSHIIAPAIHLNRKQIEQDFRTRHQSFPADRVLDEPAQLVAEARQVLRNKFLESDVGITGANFLVAETGSTVIVTNEGNGDLTQCLPRVHIVVASIEKIVPTLEDTSTILRVLARSATGQEFSSYTTFSTGPKKAGDPDGPENFHVVLLDNGRTEMLGTEFQEMLRCIRCGACMNHCPVYQAVGGHSYGWVYPGPMGAVLAPSLLGIDRAGHLPNASTFCGRCEDVCPMRIPLPKMMRHWREREFQSGQTSAIQKAGLKIWAYFAKRPRLYHFASRQASRLFATVAGRKSYIRSIPFDSGWTAHRDLPTPQGRTFQELWEADKERQEKS